MSIDIRCGVGWRQSSSRGLRRTATPAGIVPHVWHRPAGNPGAKREGLSQRDRLEVEQRTGLVEVRLGVVGYVARLVGRGLRSCLAQLFGVGRGLRLDVEQ